MARKLETRYSFTPGAAGVGTIELDVIYQLNEILMITNVTDNVVIYNFSDTTRGGTMTWTLSTTEPKSLLTLDYDTTGMSSGDILQIYVESSSVTMTFEDRFIDPVSKFRISQPQTLIDTDFEYGLQATKWETLELVNNIPGFFSKTGDTPLTIIQATAVSGSRNVTVNARAHGLIVGTPIDVRGLRQATMEGSYLVSTVPDLDTFTFVARTESTSTGTISGVYTTIIPGKFYAGSDVNYATIETDGATPSVITVTADYATGFTANTEFYIINTLGTSTLSFDASTSVSFADTYLYNQIFNPNGTGSLYATATRVVDPWDFVSVLATRFFRAGAGGDVALRSVTITSHGFTGNTTAVAVVAGPNSTVPTGLADARGYFVKVVNANTIAFAANIAGAGIAGQDIDLTANSGSGIIGLFRGYAPTAAAVNDQLTFSGLNTLFNGTGITNTIPLLWFTSNATSGLQTVAGGIFAKSVPTHLYSGVTGTVVYWKGDAAFNVISLTAGGGANVDITGTAISAQTIIVPIVSNSTGNSLYIPGHGFVDSEPMLYYTAGGTAIGGLTGNTTYFIDYISTSQFGLKPTAGGARINFTSYAATGTTHELQSNRILANANSFSISAHGLSTGSQVLYSLNGGTLIGGLTDAATYYVIDATTNTFRLSESQGGTPLNLTSAGVGTQQFLRDSVGAFDGTYLVANVAENTKSFTLNSQFTVPTITRTFTSASIASSLITVASHRYVTGTRVLYDQGTGTAPTGLTDGQEYYVIRINQDTLRLAGNLAASFTATSIDLINAGTGTDHSFVSQNLAGETEGTGTVAVTIDSSVVTGTGTTFLRSFKTGDTIVIDNGTTAYEYVVQSVLSDTKITLVTDSAITGTGLTYLLKTTLYIKSGAYGLHRPFDGGVEINAGYRSDTQIVRQTRRYFRYQSGKGIQCSLAINFNPPIDIQSLSANSTVATATTRKVHGLQTGQGIIVRDAEVSSGTNYFNGTFTVASVPNETTFTYTLAGTPSASSAEGFPALVVTDWGGVRLRAGMYDFQNGMFWEYDGINLAVVRRNSTQQIAGTIAVTTRSNLVTGTGTFFLSQLDVGGYIVIRGQCYKVVAIDSNTSLTIQPAYRGIDAEQVISSRTVDAKITQANWNLDKCDGSGPSRYILDTTRIQMTYMDYSWYGAGKVRFGFKGVDGDVFYCHVFRHNNRENEAYLRSGNMPARYEILNVGTPRFAPSLAHWGTSIIMDGLFEDDNAYLFTAPSKFLTYSGSSATVTGETGGTYVYVNSDGTQGNVISTQSNIAWTAGGGTVNTTNEQITINNHGLSSGQLVKYNFTGGGTIVTGLTNAAYYYVNRVNANTVRLSSSYLGGVAGTNIVNITGAGSGAQTFQHTFVFVPTTTVIPGYGSRIIHRFTTTGTGYAAIGNVPFGTLITATAIANRGLAAYVYKVGPATTPTGGAVVDFFFTNEILTTATSDTNGPLATGTAAGFIAASTSQAANHTVGSSASIPSLIPLISIRLSPSVDSGLTGVLGERDVINRMQMTLQTVGASTTHDIELRLVLNGQLNNNDWVNQGVPSLSQLVIHNDTDTVTNGINIFNFRATGNAPTSAGLRTANTFSADISTILALGNAILGGDGTYPDGPDVLTLAAIPLSTSGITVNSPFSVAGRISWSESQA